MNNTQHQPTLADALLQTGLIPFLPGDILKIILAALALPVGWRLLQK